MTRSATSFFFIKKKRRGRAREHVARIARTRGWAVTKGDEKMWKREAKGPSVRSSAMRCVGQITFDLFDVRPWAFDGESPYGSVLSWRCVCSVFRTATTGFFQIIKTLDNNQEKRQSVQTNFI